MILFLATLKNYVKYFPKYFKIIGIMLLSILILYLIFELTLYFPRNSDLDSYEIFIDEILILIENFSIDKIFASDFLSSTLKEIFYLMGGTEINLTLSTIMICFSLLIVVSAFFYSKSDCKKAIRLDVQNKDTANMLKRNIFSYTMNIIFWILIFVVTYYWFFAIFLLPFVILIFEALKTLIYTWYVFFRKYKKSQIITAVNCLKLVAINFLMLYVHIQIFILLTPYFGIYILLLLALSSYAYITSITQFTATKYFVDKRAHREIQIAK